MNGVEIRSLRDNGQVKLRRGLQEWRLEPVCQVYGGDPFLLDPLLWDPLPTDALAYVQGRLADWTFKEHS